MAKVVRWRGQFADIDNTAYTVEIYGEDTGVAVKTITLGANPLVTTMDSSKEKFAPIRTTTGTLEILDIDGTLVDEILPNTTADEYFVVRQGNKIVWSGYVSCEQYDYDYIANPHTLTLNLIDVLEASKYVHIKQSDIDALTGGTTSILPMNYLMALFVQSGQIGITDSYVSVEDAPHWSDMNNVPYVDTTVLFNTEEIIDSRGFVSTLTEGMSHYDIIKSICELMGWCISINGTTLYARRVLGSGDYTGKTHKEVDIHNLSYNGTSHQASVYQGARRIDITCDASMPTIGLDMPQIQDGVDTTIYSNRGSYVDSKDDQERIEYDEVTNRTQLLVMHKYISSVNLKSNTISTPTEVSISTQGWLSAPRSAGRKLFSDLINGDSSSMTSITAESYLAKFESGEQDGPVLQGESSEDSMICKMLTMSNAGTPSFSVYNYPLFSIKSKDKIFIKSGTLRLTSSMKMIGMIHENVVGGHTYFKTGMETEGVKLYMSIRIGNKYWNGSIVAGAWSTTRKAFEVELTKEGILKDNAGASRWYTGEDEGQIVIPTQGDMYGDVEVSVYPVLIQYPYISGSHDIPYIAELLVSSLSLDFNKRSNRKYRSSNQYTTILSLNNRDTISVDMNYATMNGNDNSGHLLMDSNHKYITELAYQDGSRRPEIDLMNRMTEHYSSPKRVLKLEVSSTNTPIQEMIVTDNSRRYVPVAEERDWRMRVSAITMIEE